VTHRRNKGGRCTAHDRAFLRMGHFPSNPKRFIFQPPSSHGDSHECCIRFQQLLAMANNTKDDRFDVPAQQETEESVLAALNELEMQLAARLRIPARTVRRQLVRMLRTGELDETALVAQWLAAYHAAMECAAERAGPPRDLSPREEQGPQEAALAAFGV